MAAQREHSGKSGKGTARKGPPNLWYPSKVDGLIRFPIDQLARQVDESAFMQGPTQQRSTVFVVLPVTYNRS